ncbi:Uncharacterised protein [Mycobacteroides abscessus subsp. abscessus]|nr:Uncharacterised protein [Mycobacteroides abscessus subsp. abscessus]
MPAAGRQSSSEPPFSRAGMSKTSGASTSTRYRSVSAMSWIMIGSVTPSTGVGARSTSPARLTTDHAR